MASRAVGNGTSVLFWLDVWNGHYLQEKLPRLFSFAKNQKISVAAFLSITDMTSHFHLPLSEQAHQEYIELQRIIQGIQLREEDKDQWSYIWGKKNIRQEVSITTCTKTFNLQGPFSGSGNQGVATN